MPVDAITEQVKLTFTLLQLALPSGQMLRAAMDCYLEAIDLFLQAGALKVGSHRRQIISPRRRISADDRAPLSTLACACGFAEIDFLPEAGARVAAGVAGERPAHRIFALAVVMHVLFGFVRVVPGELRVEAAVLPALEPNDFRAHDPLQRMQDRARAETLKRVAPLEPFAQIDGVVVAVGIPESHEQAPGDVAPKGIDQLLAQ